ncbi:Gfo/Idh/MocA family protein [Paenibacillus mucilaginosus]|uniref:Oxidoreductase domain-containing protein n=3 Tax=Paenibacillus mucilaginosus TaxID=61624 RepID=H6NKJ5_9BACL|nr:Gfo/Idh/MocA family oxidoreductase [Paenibacillus mucilaginosus]AEI44593.1 oxidoreductase domain protein [Paenibacillus mucilaginosus KNP414]AFC32386.1 oxidoreductase domain-containing protein [Paenibacillus mucilaginosus 3016]AFH64696.1 dehydrogenase [Paenibacillus mucilaginosus K02]MCG7215533.1 Gfo/Idh/MocA family oxidoreductase [Paenibacillus mucilaginosus]WDM26164.1 Gfo/Idh/MocA family oxidoreductase [Paenibacillus mucilaginosus]
MGSIRVGIIGTGFSAQAHVDMLRRLPGIEVTAVAGTDSSKALEFAERLRVPKAYERAEELIRDPDIDVVHNCTPNDMHYPLNRSVLEEGKHLLSEKPLAMNSEESGILCRLERERNVVAGVCFNYRHYPLISEARKWISEQKYGRPHMVIGEYLQDWLLFDTDINWRLDPERGGASRAVADIGSHWCDLVQFVLDSPITEVFADLKTIHPVRTDPAFKEVEVQTEDCGSVLVHFEDGTQGMFAVSQVSAGRKNKLRFEISARTASIAWNQERPNELWIGKRDEPNQTLMKDPNLLSARAASFSHYPGGHQEGWPDALRNLFHDFYEAVREKKEGLPKRRNHLFATLQDGHRIMKLIEAILLSHRERRWIRVEE